MKEVFKKCVIAGAGGLATLTPVVALAAVAPSTISPPTGGNWTVSQVLMGVVNFVLIFAAVVAVLFLIIGGIYYIISGGNEDRVKKAKAMIFSAVIGLLVIVLSYVIVNFTINTAKEVTSKVSTESSR